MPDTAALNIINLNIDSIQVEIAECKTDIEQEIHNVSKGCTNMDADVITKQDTNIQNDQNITRKWINFFLFG